MTIGRRVPRGAGRARRFRTLGIRRRPDQGPARSPRLVARLPSVALETYMNSAAMHPPRTFAARAIETSMNYVSTDPDRGGWTSARQATGLEERHGQLIGATAN